MPGQITIPEEANEDDQEDEERIRIRK